MILSLSVQCHSILPSSQTVHIILFARFARLLFKAAQLGLDEQQPKFHKIAAASCLLVGSYLFIGCNV